MFQLGRVTAIVSPIMLSVIIPTLNANDTLPATLVCLQAGRDVAGIGEIIVADGGSKVLPDDQHTRLLRSAPGRGVQMATGAAAAGGDWLLFLHADTVPGEGWQQAVATHMATSTKAAVFVFRLDDEGKSARVLELLVKWRCRLFALPYGDQGLLVSRRLYDETGGFKPMPLMEDVDIIRRIGRSRLAFLDAHALTSAARYMRDGYLRRMVRNMACLVMWFTGVSPERIAGFYR